MKKTRVNEPDVLSNAGCVLQRNPSDYIPVILVIALSILAVSFSGSLPVHLKKETSSPQGLNGSFVWLSTSPGLKDMLYLLDPEELLKIFPDLFPLLPEQSTNGGDNSAVKAIRYSAGLYQPMDLPPHVANIFCQPIPINRTDKDILESLPGIGPTLAEKIIQQRNLHGPFKSKDELLEIPGIGPKKLARLVDSITLN